MKKRNRYVVAGTGRRGLFMFAQPMLDNPFRHSELVGFFDHNKLRVQAANELLGCHLPGYTNFDRMLIELDPDGVIIASRDDTHARYIIAALEAGKRVISEKPLCVNARQARDILAAAKRAKARGGSCWVTHNMRYMPEISECKRQLDAGVIGALKAITFEEMLDRRHGADYFRRWHRQKKNSGGLLIHKASHHFDVLNWLAGSLPNELTAKGGLLFYGSNGAFRGTRCAGCRHARKCDFFADMWQSEQNRKLYLDPEKADGYMRDGCVFDPIIDIEDQASVLYNYANGVHVTYTLTAFASYEGLRVAIEGTKGRLELTSIRQTNWAAGNIVVYGLEKVAGQSFTLYSPTLGVKALPIPRGEDGGHGGADPQIRSDLFDRPLDAKPTARMASLEQAVQAVLIGHAANVSIAHGGRPVNVQDFLA